MYVSARITKCAIWLVFFISVIFKKCWWKLPLWNELCEKDDCSTLYFQFLNVLGKGRLLFAYKIRSFKPTKALKVCVWFWNFIEIQKPTWPRRIRKEATKIVGSNLAWMPTENSVSRGRLSKDNLLWNRTRVGACFLECLLREIWTRVA